MTNFEKYKDEMLEIARANKNIAVDETTGKPYVCSGAECANCKFFYKHNSCSSQTVEWLYEEYKELIKISAFAKMCLERLKNSGYEYLARDKNHHIAAYNKKPIKSDSAWTALYLLHCDEIIGAFDDFDFIKWEDEEPWSIQNILDNCEVVED